VRRQVLVELLFTGGFKEVYLRSYARTEGVGGYLLMMISISFERKSKR